MPKFSLLILFSLLFYKGYSQLPVLQWAKMMESNYGFPGAQDLNNSRSVGVDPQGNVFTVGVFKGTVDFDPGPGVMNLVAAGPFDFGVYISKLSPDGNFIWAEQLPVIFDFSDAELTVDNAGNVYVTASFNSPADMDPGSAVHMASPIGGRDAFIVKVDPNGNLIWMKQFGGPGDTVALPTAIDIDGNGNVYTVGTFINTVDFDPGAGTSNLVAGNHWVGFISKLDENGDFIWAKQIGNFSAEAGTVGMRYMQCDQAGNCFFSGTFAGNCDFDPGSAEFRIRAAGLMDGFVCSLDANGNFKWARHIGNSLENYYVDHHALTIDEDDNVYTCGTFTGEQDFDPGPNIAKLTFFNSGRTPYILKLDKQGNYAWAKSIAYQGTGVGADVTVDAGGNVFTSANLTGDVDFGPGNGQTVFTGVHDETFITKFKADGSLVYTAPLGENNYSFSLGRRLIHDNAANLYMTGYFYGQIDFDPGPGIFNLYGASSGTPFVIKLSKCLNPTDSTLEMTVCNSYVLNGHNYDESGTYVQSIVNAAGCDSTITLHLTINRKATTQSKTICEGSTFFAGGSMQATAGIYTDTLLSASGCDSVVTTHLFVNERPSPALGADRHLCQDNTIELSPGEFLTYAWQDGSSQNNFVVSTPGKYFVTVTNSFNCAAGDTINILATVPGPKDFLKPTDSVCVYKALNIEPFNNYAAYLWSTGSLEKTIDVTSSGQYWLEVKDDNGCMGRDSIYVYPKDCQGGIYIPTAFSPDGNGKNDLFKAQVFGITKSFRLQVFNRWGQLVFETKDPQKGWDGSLSGGISGSTVFVWVCSYQLENEPFRSQRGTVLLVR